MVLVIAWVIQHPRQLMIGRSAEHGYSLLWWSTWQVLNYFGIGLACVDLSRLLHISFLEERRKFLPSAYCIEPCSASMLNDFGIYRGMTGMLSNPRQSSTMLFPWCKWQEKSMNYSVFTMLHSTTDPLIWTHAMQSIFWKPNDLSSMKVKE